MLDLKFIRENEKLVQKNCTARLAQVDVAALKQEVSDLKQELGLEQRGQARVLADNKEKGNTP